MSDARLKPLVIHFVDISVSWCPQLGDFFMSGNPFVAEFPFYVRSTWAPTDFATLVT